VTSSRLGAKSSKSKRFFKDLQRNQQVLKCAMLIRLHKALTQVTLSTQLKDMDLKA
jgi:hypothetical protein